MWVVQYKNTRDTVQRDPHGMGVSLKVKVGSLKPESELGNGRCIYINADHRFKSLMGVINIPVNSISFRSIFNLVQLLVTEMFAYHPVTAKVVTAAR